MTRPAAHESCTAIAATTDGETIWMGADSAIVADDHIFESKASKVVKPGGSPELLIGITGRIRALNLVRHHLTLPDRKDQKGPEYIFTLAGALRVVFDDGGLLHSQNGPDEWCGRALVGMEGAFYQIGPRFSVTPMAKRYAAIGSGKECATGALRGLGPGERAVREAVEAAIAHDPHSQTPITIKQVSG